MRGIRSISKFDITIYPRFRPPRRPPRIIDHPALDAINYRELEYAYLYRSTEDKDGLESIKALHRQLDDDNDGSIEPSETGEFIRGDLKKVKYCPFIFGCAKNT